MIKKSYLLFYYACPVKTYDFQKNHVDEISPLCVYFYLCIEKREK